MPILPCEKDGKKGHKAGESGKCYTGKGSEEKAKEQLAAIKSRQTKDSCHKFKG